MKNPLIIEKPELQTITQRYGWSSVTFFFWILYIYLWIPLITLVAWLVGAKLFHLNMIQLKGYEGLVDNLGLYSLIIVLISVILIGWAEIDRMRFKNKLRRLDHEEVTISDIAKKYNLQENQLTQLRQKKSMIVHFSDKGAISDIVEYIPSSN